MGVIRFMRPGHSHAELGLEQQSRHPQAMSPPEAAPHPPVQPISPLEIEARYVDSLTQQAVQTLSCKPLKEMLASATAPGKHALRWTNVVDDTLQQHWQAFNCDTQRGRDLARRGYQATNDIHGSLAALHAADPERPKDTGDLTNEILIGVLENKIYTFADRSRPRTPEQQKSFYDLLERVPLPAPAAQKLADRILRDIHIALDNRTNQPADKPAVTAQHHTSTASAPRQTPDLNRLLHVWSHVGNKANGSVNSTIIDSVNGESIPPQPLTRYKANQLHVLHQAATRSSNPQLEHRYAAMFKKAFGIPITNYSPATPSIAPEKPNRPHLVAGAMAAAVQSVIEHTEGPGQRGRTAATAIVTAGLLASTVNAAAAAPPNSGRPPRGDRRSPTDTSFVVTQHEPPSPMVPDASSPNAAVAPLQPLSPETVSPQSMVPQGLVDHTTTMANSSEVNAVPQAMQPEKPRTPLNPLEDLIGNGGIDAAAAQIESSSQSDPGGSIEQRNKILYKTLDKRLDELQDIIVNTSTVDGPTRVMAMTYLARLQAALENPQTLKDLSQAQQADILSGRGSLYERITTQQANRIRIMYQQPDKGTWNGFASASQINLFASMLGTCELAAMDQTKVNAMLERARDGQTDPADTTPHIGDIDMALSGNKISAAALKQYGVPEAYISLYIKNGLRYGVSPFWLAAQGNAESSFDPNALSPAGASGLGQQMPGTWSSWKQRLKLPSGATPFMPEYSIQVQAAIMADNLRQVKTNGWGKRQSLDELRLASAGYNAGMGAVDKYNGVPPYTETRNYVAKIQRDYVAMVTNAQALKNQSDEAIDSVAAPSATGREAYIKRLIESGNFRGSEAKSDNSAEAPRTPLKEQLIAAGQKNGQLDDKYLEKVGEHWGELRLHAAAARAFRDLDAAFFAEFGEHLEIMGSRSAYRTIQEQKEIYSTSRHGFAAKPGGSMHGWGLAVDLKGMGNNDTRKSNWMKKNAIRFTFVHPAFAQDPGTPEAWHWEFWGVK
jgi:LAS superfamily LD-carboxypeptidase LdcB